jgi:hypothetical protein
MAITASQLQFRTINGVPLASGKLNNLFGNIYTNGVTSYASLAVCNLNPTLTLTAVRAWLTPDPKGGTVSLAYDSTTGLIGVAAPFGVVDAAVQSYSIPTSLATGLVLPDMGPETKVRLFLKRVMSGSTTAVPESNRVWIGGTSPL